jgi:hypothetical protein
MKFQKIVSFKALNRPEADLREKECRSEKI